MEGSLPLIPAQVKLTYNGNDFLLDIAEGNMISLNAIYKIAGCPENQDPNQWKRLPKTQELIEALAKKLHVAKNQIVRTQRGKSGGTWAHWQLGMAYALYLGDVNVQLALFQSIKDLNTVLSALNAFEVEQDILDACEVPLYVYAIREIDTGNIKIGISRDPQKRLEQLQTGNSSPLELVAIRLAKNGYRDEQEMHKLNLDSHIRGEWFSQPVKFN